MKKLAIFFVACVAFLIAELSGMAQTSYTIAYDFSSEAPTGQMLYYSLLHNGSDYYVCVAAPIYYNNPNSHYSWDGYEKPTGVLIIPDSVDYEGNRYEVREIRAEAFNECWELREVTVPNSVQIIRQDAFYGVGLVHYNGSAYVYGNSWGALSLNGYVEDGLVYANSSRTKLLTYIGDNQSVLVPSTVDTIGDYAFYKNQSITSVQLPEGLVSIGGYAFNECTNLASINIPSSVVVIGNRAFAICYKLGAVTVPSTISYVGNYAFSGVRLVYYSGSESTSYWGAVCVNGFLDGDFCYTDSTRTHLAAYMGNATDVVIPSTVHTIGVDAFSYRDDITSVVIPTSVTTIQICAFYRCYRLEPVSIPNTVTTIGYNAFYGVKLIYYYGTDISYNFNNWGAYNKNGFLEDGLIYTDSTKTWLTGFVGSQSIVDIPSTVTSIFHAAFAYCGNLREIHYPNTLTGIWGLMSGTSYISSGDYAGSDSIHTVYLNTNMDIPLPLASLQTLVIGDSVLQVRDSACMGATNLSSVTLGANINSVGVRAFKGCSSLATINIPETVESIGDEAFFGCKSLSQMTIPANVVSIGNKAFANCTGLTTINYHSADCEYQYEGEMGFGKALFAGDTNITTLNIGSTVRRIPALAFATLGIDTLVLHDSVLYIGKHAFSYCSNLRSLTIGRYTDTIMQAFAWDTALQTINFNADSCRYMGYMQDGNVSSAFGAVDTAVTTINIGPHVKSIPDYAFQSMTNLVEVNLPASLRHIGQFAFARTGISGHLVIPDSVRYIGWYAFRECDSITALTIGRQVDTIDRTSFLLCGSLRTVYFNADSCHYMGGVIGNNSWAPFGNDTSLSELYIGANVKYIPDYSFARYDSYVGFGLRHIYWGDSVQYIGNYAFYSTRLTDTIVLPESVEQIGDRAFKNCDSITAMVIGENVSSIGSYSFASCDNLRSITLYAETPPSLVSNAFNNTPGDKVFYIPCGTTSAYNSAWGYFNYVEPEVDFGVMLNANDWSMGSVMAVSSRINCVDSSFIIRAIPNNHYHLVGWYDASQTLIGTSNPDTLYLSSDTMVTAIFAPDRYQINVVSNDTVHGTVSGSGEYDYLDTITLSALAVEHYHFVRWSNGWQSYYDNPQQYVVTSNATLTAYFSIDQHHVSVSSSDDMKGVVSGGGYFNYGSPCTLTATAYTGYQFVGWSNGQTANPYAFPVTEDVELVAMFTEAGAETATVNVISADPAMGTATVNGGSTATVTVGDSVALLATSNVGYRFMRWNDNNTDSSRIVTVTADIVYIAYFESAAEATYNVTAASADPSMGTATVNGSSTVTVAADESVTLLATPNNGYRFVRWSDNNTDSSRIVTVTCDIVYIAYFESASTGMYTVTATSDDPSMGRAFVNDDSIAVVNPGETVILTAIPGVGYRFVRWNDNSTDNIRAVVVIGDMNFIAYFEMKTNPNAVDDVMMENYKVYQCDGCIVVEGDLTEGVSVYDAVGRLLTHATGTYSSTTATRRSPSPNLGEERNGTTDQYRMPVPASGVYLVKVGNRPARRVVVVR